jgi:hypothetical protein
MLLRSAMLLMSMPGMLSFCWLCGEAWPNTAADKRAANRSASDTFPKECADGFHFIGVAAA